MTPAERVALIQFAYSELTPQQQSWIDELAEGVISHVKTRSNITQMSRAAAMEVIFIAGRVLNGEYREDTK